MPGGRSLDAAALRREFDLAFARPLPGTAPPTRDLLLVRAAEHAYALALDELLAVHAARKVVAAPSSHPGFLGLAGLRGVVVPVYDLRQLLGHAAVAAPRWLAQLSGPSPLALGFDLLERHVRVPESSILAGQGSVGGAALETEAGAVPIIDLSAIRAQIAAQSPRAPSPAPQEVP